ncbi:MAG: hypothetical protein COW08_01115 [Ignavibacteriales bacterium CG12_big_fil_rev_8_21_14_0_65_30_8]|nr:MAG: hypothetical protein COW08_01115 [Ignavibacteriales bacterium CG12_big_fil_rev_8_21_14_0_65_30_8]
MVLLLLSHNLFSGVKGVTGEIIFNPINLGSQTYSITVSTNEYCWVWDTTTNKTVFLPTYSFNKSGLTGDSSAAFSEPKAANRASFGTIPWGKMIFDIQSTYGVNLSFTIDLRDVGWSQDTSKYWTHDTYINFDFTVGENGFAFLSQGAPKDSFNINDATQISLSSTVYIWSFWSPNSSPAQSAFKVPVTLFNKIEENPSISFGFLNANGNQVFSGDYDLFNFNQNQTVFEGTLDTIYNSQRYYSFNWLPNQNVSGNSSNLYNSSFNFSVGMAKLTKSITRNFRTVWPLTIKNNLGEVGGISIGNISFKDPITDNTYHSYSATETGFLKDNAFDSLSILVGSNPNQKYGAKAVSTINYNGRNYQYSGGDFSTSGTDFIITGPTTKTAYYKGTQLSSNINAFTNNSQRKIVRTPDGVMHLVYESLDRVWYEISTDNGATWEIMNGGSSVSTGTAKLVSADYFNTTQGNVIAIVYQAYNSIGSNLILDLYLNGVFQQTNGLAIYSHSSGEIDAFNTNPIVAINSNGQILVSWYVDGEIAGTTSGLYYKYGYIYLAYGLYPVISWYTSSPVIISGSGIATFNPSVSAYKSALQPFQLVYENSNQIYHLTLTDNANHINHIEESTPQVISSGSGFARNNNPSITAINGGAYAVWEGRKVNRVTGIPKPSWAVAKNLITGVFSNFSNSNEVIDALAPNINIAVSNSKVVLAWSENLSGYVGEPSPSTLQSLNISGKYIQLNNGGTKSQMYATTLNIGSEPFYFNLSNNIGSYLGLNKSKAGYNTSIIIGRKGVVYNNGTEFYFNIGEINVDGQNINFNSIPDTAAISEEEMLNKYLVSDSFILNNNSDFTYSVNYGIADSLSAVKLLSKDNSVSFTVELIDVKTQKVIGVYDEVKYTQSNTTDYNNIKYKVDTKGIGNREVF